MKIALDLIKPSPNPVRTSWDEDKMNELAQSIKEQGLIVPIKVRPNGSGYEIVYGHRRVEASKRAGLAEVEAIVEGVDDTGQLVQALIENVQREDMEPLDIARSLQSLLAETGWSLLEIERRGLLSDSTASRYLKLLDLPPNIQSLIASDASTRSVPEGKIPYRHISEIAGVGLRPEEQGKVLEKAAREALSQRQIRKVAESVTAAPTDQAKAKLLEWEFSPTLHDPELIRERAKTHGPHDPIYRDNKPSPQKAFDDSPEVKMLLDGITLAIKTFVDLMTQIQSVVGIGKLAPEGKQFMAHKLRGFRNKLDNLIQELEGDDG